ncbi:hypothetical protein ACFWBC_40050 [Streptomyces sp. NPDC059985]|uniref:hypothetical protein n=1 Tax=Streptomyces sp. NPDC059985 TaxID=3347025 RepID=UPI0036BE3193
MISKLARNSALAIASLSLVGGVAGTASAASSEGANSSSYVTTTQTARVYSTPVPNVNTNPVMVLPSVTKVQAVCVEDNGTNINGTRTWYRVFDNDKGTGSPVGFVSGAFAVHDGSPLKRC